MVQIVGVRATNEFRNNSCSYDFSVIVASELYQGLPGSAKVGPGLPSLPESPKVYDGLSSSQDEDRQCAYFALTLTERDRLCVCFAFTPAASWQTLADPGRSW